MTPIKSLAAFAVILTVAVAGCSRAAHGPRRPAEPTTPSASTADDERHAIIQERHALLMLAALSHAYAGLDQPLGHDISAVLAWNVNDTKSTPEFVINRNRNNEKQGDVYHAEVNALHSAYEKRREYNVPPLATATERRALFDGRLSTATIYTTLEPCPMCTTTITMAKVPQAVFCMDDPGLRDSVAHETKIPVPTSFYGRRLDVVRSDLSACTLANQAMWRAATAAGPKFNVTAFLATNGRTVFVPAWKELACWELGHTENETLLRELRRATGVPDCTK